MIRINLLPSGKRQFRAPGNVQAWGVAYLVLGFVACGVLGVVYFARAATLDEQRAANRALQAELDRTKSQTSGLEALQGKLDKSRAFEEVVGTLEGTRNGPAWMLRELTRILSADSGPTIDPDKLHKLRQDNPLAGYNPGWDTRRLWLTSFEESGQKCVIKGRGKSNEDVAEFLRRLSLSEVFGRVALERTNAIVEGKLPIPLIEFTLTCKVNY